MSRGRFRLSDTIEKREGLAILRWSNGDEGGLVLTDDDRGKWTRNTLDKYGRQCLGQISEGRPPDHHGEDTGKLYFESRECAHFSSDELRQIADVLDRLKDLPEDVRRFREQTQ